MCQHCQIWLHRCMNCYRYPRRVRTKQQYHRWPNIQYLGTLWVNRCCPMMLKILVPTHCWQRYYRHRHLLKGHCRSRRHEWSCPVECANRHLCQNATHADRHHQDLLRQFQHRMQGFLDMNQHVEEHSYSHHQSTSPCRHYHLVRHLS